MPSPQQPSADASFREPEFEGYAFGSAPDDYVPRHERFEPQDWVALELSINSDRSAVWTWHLPHELLSAESPERDPLFPPPNRIEQAKALGLKTSGQLARLLNGKLDVDISLDLAHSRLDSAAGAWISIARVGLKANQNDIDLSGVPAWLNAGLQSIFPDLAPMLGPEQVNPGDSIISSNRLFFHARGAGQAHALMQKMKIERCSQTASRSSPRPSL